MTRKQVTEVSDGVWTVEQERKSGCRWLLGLLVLGGVLVAVLVGLGIFSAYRGIQERERRQVVTSQNLAEQHYGRALQYLNRAEYERAIAELERTLTLNPGHPDALAKLEEARQGLNVVPTPLPTLDEDSAAVVYEEAQKAYTQGDWLAAAAYLEQVVSIDEDYRFEETASLLFSSYYNSGVLLADEGRFEEAIQYFDKALSLRPDDANAEGQKYLAALYVTAQSFWQVDWGKVIENLQKIYEMQPDYKDVRRRLHDAHVNYGDYWAERNRWCEAEAEYAQALAFIPDLAETQREQAAELCENITTTITATLTITPGATVTATVPPPIILRGKIVYAVYDAGRRTYDIYITDVDGTDRAQFIAEAHQPAFGTRGQFAYKSLRNDRLGLALADAEGNYVSNLTNFVEDVLPRWSADGNWIAFVSTREADRKWRIYTLPLGQNSLGSSVDFGRYITWMPNGLITYTGCDGAGACGLISALPNGSNLTMLTGYHNDIAPAWSPDGRRLAFMSDQNGNWDVYVYHSFTRATRRMTTASEVDGLPAWSPDGNFIAYVTNRDGRWSMYAMRYDGSDHRKLFDLGGGYAADDDWMYEQIAWIW